MLGFSTQNFLKALPLSVDNLKELFDFASEEGYDFIELRDPSADLREEDCLVLADYALKKDVEVIYEIHKDLIDTALQSVFDRAVTNTAFYGEPGIIPTILTWS